MCACLSVLDGATCFRCSCQIPRISTSICSSFCQHSSQLQCPNQLLILWWRNLLSNCGTQVAHCIHSHTAYIVAHTVYISHSHCYIVAHTAYISHSRCLLFTCPIILSLIYLLPFTCPFERIWLLYGVCVLIHGLWCDQLCLCAATALSLLGSLIINLLMGVVAIAVMQVCAYTM